MFGVEIFVILISFVLIVNSETAKFSCGVDFLLLNKEKVIWLVGV